MRHSRLLDTLTPTKHAFRKHMAVLMMQAIFIVLLAITFVGLEVRTQVLEASVPNIVRSVVIDESGNNFLADADGDADGDGQNTPAVLGEEDSIDPNITPEPAVADIIELDLEYERLMRDIEVSPTPLPAPPKDTYTIAIYGDSMVDTMGERLEYLHRELTTRYPETEFKLYNYGIGSQNIIDGIARWRKPLAHIDRSYPAITQIRPDVIIVGSFGYNVLSPHDRNMHWLKYTELVQLAQQISPRVYMLAEIIPCRHGFGFGPNGVNWEPATAWSHTGKIIEQLENVIGLSSTLGVPLVDAFTPSISEERKDCKRELVNPSDNIHPSVEGHTFIAKIIADTIELK